MQFSSMSDALDRVCKRQKLSASISHNVIDEVGHEIQQALGDIQSGHVATWALVDIQSDGVATSLIDQRSIIAELKNRLTKVGPLGKLEDLQKEQSINLSKCQKVLEKTFNPDIAKAYRYVDFDRHSLNQVILSHFYREGLFDVADSLINEAAEPEVISLRWKFVEMHQILEAVKYRNLEPALRWATENQEELNNRGSLLKLTLHKLQFVEILQNSGRKDAITYVKTHLVPQASSYLGEIQKLMCSILWAGKLETSPYSEMVAPWQWGRLTEDLTQQFCSFVGQSTQSPLSVALAAGIEGLPTLLKLATVMAGKKQDWQAMKYLPVPVELSKEFQFHSVFVCPVSREQGSQENPPMMLPCGHVLCKHSIHKLSKSCTRSFKCPYCPQDATASDCRQIFF
ncbi:OLC1v1002787C1 [Oldenlandia corymbosa var. corymbosa]|uniref:OLC1v1002787C1 n=1 Tax=Oldenlandia corymbosa var. corymbosa TaxID=529605 RepID=A0AAV1D9B6_OLDCO|nr:OLC1v1002787C1 [Oldenlandia corymbosa var. corymbosa]